MSFSFNENLLMEDSIEGINILSKMKQDEIKDVIQVVALREVTIDGLIHEFKTLTSGFKTNDLVTEENLKSYFSIVLNGISKILYELGNRNFLLKPYIENGLYENMYVYIDSILDELDFEELFGIELKILNNQ